MFRANDVNYLDGQSLVWASRLLGLSAEERVATTDVALPLAQMCKRRDFGLFLLGGQPEVAQKAAARLEAQVPGLKTYTHDGFFTPDQDEQVVQAIVASGAKVVLVGLGDPRQQQWVQQHRYQVNGVMLTCGGLFDWISGNNRRPPQWMVGWGLEWLWRMWLEPRRLARRYLVGNPEFLLRLAGAWFFRR
nr:WecB/TagA/CpsF family glycosyltransferase [Kineosporia babensis]